MCRLRPFVCKIYGLVCSRLTYICSLCFSAVKLSIHVHKTKQYIYNVMFTLVNHIAYISWSDCQKINHVHVYIVNLCTYKTKMCSKYVRVTIIFDLSVAIYVHTFAWTVYSSRTSAITSNEYAQTLTVLKISKMRNFYNMIILLVVTLNIRVYISRTSRCFSFRARYCRNSQW